MIANFFPAHLVEGAVTTMAALMFLIPQDAGNTSDCYFLRPDTLSTACYTLLNDIADESINGFVTFEQFEISALRADFPSEQLLQFFESHKLCTVVAKGIARIILFPDLCQSLEPLEATALIENCSRGETGSRVKIGLAFLPFGFFAKLVCTYANSEGTWYISNPNHIWRNAFLLCNRVGNALCIVEVDAALNSVVATVSGDQSAISTLFHSLIASLDSCGFSLTAFPPSILLELRQESDLKEAPVFRIAEIIQWLAKLEANGNKSSNQTGSIVQFNQTVHGDINMRSEEYNFKNISGQIANVGKNNSVSHSTVTQGDVASSESIQHLVLAEELSRLRAELRSQATELSHDVAIGNIAAAEAAARAGDVNGAVSLLKGAGKWAFDIASKIGIQVAAKAISGALEG